MAGVFYWVLRYGGDSVEGREEEKCGEEQRAGRWEEGFSLPQCPLFLIRQFGLDGPTLSV